MTMRLVHRWLVDLPSSKYSDWLIGYGSVVTYPSASCTCRGRKSLLLGMEQVWTGNKTSTIPYCWRIHTSICVTLVIAELLYVFSLDWVTWSIVIFRLKWRLKVVWLKTLRVVGGIRSSWQSRLLEAGRAIKAHEHNFVRLVCYSAIDMWNDDGFGFHVNSITACIQKMCIRLSFFLGWVFIIFILFGFSFAFLMRCKWDLGYSVHL